MKNTIIIEDWGRIDYKIAWDRQYTLQKELIDRKVSARRRGETYSGNHYLVFCEHDPVYTLGKSGNADHLLVDAEFLSQQGIQFYKINRGGDITYHGPGQLVVYPILDLELVFTDVHRYIRSLEEAVIRTMAEYHVEGFRFEGFTGVWTGQNPVRKICAIGVHLSRWVSMHGLAFNISPDLSLFKNIVPCGISDDQKAVTSLTEESGVEADMEEVKSRFLLHFNELFNIGEYEKREVL